MARNEAASWRNYVVSITRKGKTYEAPVEDNLVMRTMSTQEIRQFLNEVSGKLTFWSNFKVDLELEMEELQEEYDEWFQELYAPIDDEYSKKTETWKKAKVAMDNKAETRDWNDKFRELRTAIKRVGVLVAGFNSTVWTVREISRLTEAEIRSIGAEGGR